MTFRLLHRVLVALTLAAPVTAHANGVPVYDAASVAKAIEQIAALADQLDELQAQTDRLQKSFEAITGPRSMGALLNGAQEQADRAFASVPLSDLSTVFEDGLALTGEAAALSDRISALREAFALKRGAELTPDQPDSLVAKRHDFRQGAALSALALAAESFDRAPDRIAGIEQMLAAIDASPDLKASVDLNARITAETALLLTQLVQLQAIDLHLAGARGHGANTARDDNARRALGADRADFKNLFR